MGDAGLAALLARFHHSEVPLDRLRALIAATPDSEQLHRIKEPVSVPDEAEAVSPPVAGDPEHARLDALGRAAIARGELAVVILAGGMATRFGSSVKALAPVLDGTALRFVDLKLADLALLGGIDTTLMTSFATDEALRDALAEAPVHFASQFISLRLNPDGSLFHDADGALSPHAPGHGDLPAALRLSGTLDRLRAAGVRTVLISNVDNVGATLDPVLAALHRELGGTITVELVVKRAGDRGGIPVRRADGSLALAETFRLPEGFPDDRFPLFNTNTLWVDLPALEGDHDWTWSVARKTVDGREAIQLERLVGELTWWNETRYVKVPRDGPESRFVPVKDREDLSAAQAQIREIWRKRLTTPA